MLPPSTAFNNRLFVERDSKFRRILTNLGLTFRNSKWTNYSKLNLNFKTTSPVLISLILILGIIVSTFLISHSSLNVLFYENTLIYFVWSTLDNSFVWASFIIWNVRTALNIFIREYTLRFISRIYKLENTKSNKTFLNPLYHYTKIKSPKPNTVVVPKKQILYTWLTAIDSTKSRQLIENLYDTKHKLNNSQSFYNFYNKLFNYTGLIALNNFNVFVLKRQFSHITFTSKTNVNIPLVRYTPNNSLLKLWLTTFFNKNNLKKSTTVAKYLETVNRETIHLINSEWLNYGHLVNTTKGLFYLTELSNSFLTKETFITKELFPITISLSDQKTLNNWTVWLYKNSSIGRDFLKFTHKLTNYRKLISSGFWTSSLSTKNIWASELTKTLTDSKTFYRNIYLGTYAGSTTANLATNSQLIKPTVSYTNNTPLGFLKNTNTSLFWLNKRIYLFNNAQEINITSTPIIEKIKQSELLRITESLRNELLLVQQKSFTNEIKPNQQPLHSVRMDKNLTNIINTKTLSPKFIKSKQNFSALTTNCIYVNDVHTGWSKEIYNKWAHAYNEFEASITISANKLNKLNQSTYYAFKTLKTSPAKNTRIVIK